MENIRDLLESVMPTDLFLLSTGNLPHLKVPTITIKGESVGDDDTVLSFPLQSREAIDDVKSKADLTPFHDKGRKMLDTNIRMSFQLLTHRLKIEGLTDQHQFEQLLNTI
jgi:hypothetical protein